MIKETRDEINFYKSKSKFKIKIYIIFFKVLRKINCKMFYFNLSLFPGLIFSYFFNISTFGFLLCHFIIWSLFNERFLNNIEIKTSNEQLDILINSLSNDEK